MSSQSYSCGTEMEFKDRSLGSPFPPIHTPSPFSVLIAPPIYHTTRLGDIGIMYINNLGVDLRTGRKEESG